MLWYSAQYRDWDLSNGTAPREVRLERAMWSAFPLFLLLCAAACDRPAASCCCSPWFGTSALLLGALGTHMARQRQSGQSTQPAVFSLTAA